MLSEYVKYMVSDLDAKLGCQRVHWDAILCRKYIGFKSVGKLGSIDMQWFQAIS